MLLACAVCVGTELQGDITASRAVKDARVFSSEVFVVMFVMRVVSTIKRVP